MQDNSLESEVGIPEREAAFRKVWVDQQRALIERLERSGRYPGHAKEMLRLVEAHASAMTQESPFPSK